MKNEVDVSLIVRMIASIIAVVNLFEAQLGFDPIKFDEPSLYLIVSTVVAIVVWGWGFWKNNNFTQAAKDAQKVLDQAKGKV